MKETKKENSSIFSNMFKDIPMFTSPLSEWHTPSVYYLKDLNEKQLQIIQMLEVEISEDDNNILFIKLNSKDNKGIINLLIDLRNAKVDYKEKLELIPSWIRKIFKAT